MSESNERESLKDETRTAIEEIRMVLPGIQALFGFQLVAIFSPRFEQLQPVLQRLHLLSLGLIAVSIALVMTPAAYHRIAERGWVSRHLIDLTSNFLSLGMAALMCGLAIETGLVTHMVLRNSVVALVIAAVLFLVFVSLWLLLPLRRRRTRGHGA